MLVFWGEGKFSNFYKPYQIDFIVPEKRFAHFCRQVKKPVVPGNDRCSEFEVIDLAFFPVEEKTAFDHPDFIKTPDPEAVGHVCPVFVRLFGQSVPPDGQNGWFREGFFNKPEKMQQDFAQKILKML